jgi:hypothetical protein
MATDPWEKADVIGKWVTGLTTGLVLLLLGKCIDDGTQRVAQSQRNAELVAALIKDLSDTTAVRKDLALIALAYAVPKDSTRKEESPDLVVEVSEHMLLATKIGPEQGGLAERLLRERSPSRWKYVESRRRGAEAAAAHPARPASDTSSAVGRTANIAPVVKNTRSGIVYLQFYPGGREAQARLEIVKLQKSLQDADFAAPGVDSVSSRTDNSVRYFHTEDRALADSVAGVVGRALPKVGPPRVYRPRYSGDKRLLEVWVNLTEP